MPIVVLLVLLLSACEGQLQGFVLPPGDEEAGRAAFVELGCNQCHGVVGSSSRDTLTVEFVPADPSTSVNVPLGGKSHVVRSYGDLVTSIVNPGLYDSPRYNDTHRAAGNPEMHDYADAMKIQQLIDITTFLQARYSLRSPRYVYYQYF